MSTWVLILTLIGGYYGGHHTAAVEGFASQQACMSAADLWLRQMSRTVGDRTFPKYVAVCAPMAR